MGVRESRWGCGLNILVTVLAFLSRMRSGVALKLVLDKITSDLAQFCQQEPKYVIAKSACVGVMQLEASAHRANSISSDLALSALQCMQCDVMTSIQPRTDLVM